MSARKKNTKSLSTEVSDYSMQTEYSRTKLPSGEYSGIQPKDLTGIPETKTVKYDLNAEPQRRRERVENNLEVEFAARDPDLDPQYIWRGKRRGDLNELEVKAPIIYQQEKIFPRMLIEEMKRRSAIRRNAADPQMLLGEGVEDFDPNTQPGFYNHEEGWKNRMILGDSLQVMASLAENESLRGKVQMIYFDPPYGIKFNSNWQPSTKTTNVKDGKKEDITREPEMVKAFRDTWHDGIHSYLGYLRDRLIVARDLLAESGSCFVQIGDANVHKVRAIMDEVFGEENWITTITVKKTSGADQYLLDSVTDFIIWFAKNREMVKYRQPYVKRKLAFDNLGPFSRIQLSDYSRRGITQEDRAKYSSPEDIGRVFRIGETSSSGSGGNKVEPFFFRNKRYLPSGNRHWSTHIKGMRRLEMANRLVASDNTVSYVRFHDDFPIVRDTNIWEDTGMGGFTDQKIYVVQTVSKVIQRCMLMTTDPGDLVLDPTCGSGTTAYVAEQWGRRWITIDTSRVALALARTRLMTAKYPYYLLADSEEGVKKEMEVTGKAIIRDTYRKVSQGFVYERVPHITLKAIANDAEIDIIWEKYAAESERLRKIMGKGV
ncbi:MAG: site-specific DNA-methyltransferase [Kiritimatiellae bacterium]|nr:site-specific DNA-methyltransferase [Kiritimatiellia bacterium]